MCQKLPYYILGVSGVNNNINKEAKVSLKTFIAELGQAFCVTTRKVMSLKLSHNYVFLVILTIIFIGFRELFLYRTDASRKELCVCVCVCVLMDLLAHLSACACVCPGF